MQYYLEPYSANDINIIIVNMLNYQLIVNELTSNNIIKILLNLFINSKQLYFFGIINNYNINGDLSELDEYFDDDFNQTSQIYFVAHKCNLYGSLPKNIHFSKLKYFIIYDNRLSCNIPNNLISNISNVNTSIILPFNLFKVKNENNIPKWIKSSFKIAKLLYITQFDEIKSIIFVILSGLGIILIIFTMNVMIVILLSRVDWCSLTLARQG